MCDTDGNEFTSTFEENGCVHDRLGLHARAHTVLVGVIDGRRVAKKGRRRSLGGMKQAAGQTGMAGGRRISAGYRWMDSR